jgi:hypothetical protein
MTGVYVMLAGMAIFVSILGVMGLRGIRHEEAREQKLREP